MLIEIEQEGVVCTYVDYSFPKYVADSLLKKNVRVENIIL
jgi:hypothetical protein